MHLLQIVCEVFLAFHMEMLGASSCDTQGQSNKYK